MICINCLFNFYRNNPNDSDADNPKQVLMVATVKMHTLPRGEYAMETSRPVTEGYILFNFLFNPCHYLSRFWTFPTKPNYHAHQV